MDSYTIAKVLAALRQRLIPSQQTEKLHDIVEGPLPNAREAAVLLALFESNAELHLAFIRRASTLRSHSGEIAFPGGGIDSSDASPVTAALREAYEEIGLHPSRVEVLGLLPPVFTIVSNYLILPVVAYLPLGLGTLQLQQSEVTEVIQAPLRALADPAITYTKQWLRGTVTRTIYFYDYGPYCIWGATGRILYTLLQTLELA